MHEMALAESILNIVEETARRQGATRVTEVRLEIGELANVEIEALQFGLEAALPGSLAEGAHVECLIIPADECVFCSAKNLPMHQNRFASLNPHGVTTVATSRANRSPIPLAQPLVILVVNQSDKAFIARVTALLPG